jgi:hypothetical protein
MGNASSGGLGSDDYLRADHEIFGVHDGPYSFRFQCLKANRKSESNAKMNRRIFELRGGRLSYFAQGTPRNAAASGEESVASGSLNLAEATVLLEAEDNFIYIKSGVADNDLRLQMDPSALAGGGPSLETIMQKLYLHVAMATIKKRCEDYIQAYEYFLTAETAVAPGSDAAPSSAKDILREAYAAIMGVEAIAGAHPDLVQRSTMNGGGVYPGLEHVWHVRAVIGLKSLEDLQTDPLDDPAGYRQVRDDFVLAMESSARRPLNQFNFLYHNVEGLSKVFVIRAEAARQRGEKHQMHILYDDLLKIYLGAVQETLRREGVTMYVSVLAENIGRTHWNGRKSRVLALESLDQAAAYANQASQAGKLKHVMASYTSLAERLAELNVLRKEIERG